MWVNASIAYHFMAIYRSCRFRDFLLTWLKISEKLFASSSMTPELLLLLFTTETNCDCGWSCCLLEILVTSFPTRAAAVLLLLTTTCEFWISWSLEPRLTLGCSQKLGALDVATEIALEVNTGLALVSLWTIGSRLFRDIEVLLFEAAALLTAVKALLLVTLLVTSRTYILDDDGTLVVETAGVALVSLNKIFKKYLERNDCLFIHKSPKFYNNIFL